MRELRGMRVLVTGAAGGIGRGAALAFAREGARLALVDIDGARLDEVAREARAAGAECATYQTDLSCRSSVEALASEVDRDSGGVDVLVNVAGVAVVSGIIDMRFEDWDWILGVNLSAPFHTIRLFVPGMRQRGFGHVVNVASAGGFVHLALIGAYCATKAALVALSEALAQELYSSGVRVTSFCPGLVGTTMVERMRFTGYSREKMLRVARLLMKRVTSPERAGELIVEAVMRDRAVVFPTGPMRIAALLNRLFPSLVRAILRRGERLFDSRFAEGA